jgi:quinolinate synthase
MKKNISLIDNIVKLKTEKDAIILAHNYQIDEIQDIADFVGDSLQLSIQASKVKNRIIVFCGVHFMAETAKIVSPGRKVLLPDKYSGCPMADMITDKQLVKLKEEYPDALVVCYVNTSARVKALSDICCTSSNAVKIVNSIPRDRQIIFIPDKYLGSYVQSQTGRKMILWNGFCPTHAKINVETIAAIKKEHPDAVLIVHPECTPDVISAADKVLSTGGMLSFVKQSTEKEFIIGTEIGLIYRLKKENPGKIFYPASNVIICPNMKLINLEKLLWSLEEEQFEIKLPNDVINKARTAIDNMLTLS